MPSEAAVRCAQLVKIYPSRTGETHALRGVEASFDAGVATAVTGPSGSGKSSLLSVLALRERQSAGELWIFGEPVAGVSRGRRRDLVRHRLAWVAQRPTHSLYPHLGARDQVIQAHRLRAVAAGQSAEAAADAVLERLGLSGQAGSRPGQMSGGEQQRLAVAVAVVAGPALVVADEPTAELDDESAVLVMAELARCTAEGAAVLFATHDERAIRAADRVLHLRHGVLSSERAGGGTAAAPIDSSGRLQLPPEALRLFPGSRALVVVEQDEVRLRAPAAEPEDPR